MKNTNCDKDCPLVKKGVCQSDSECPNYIESIWINNQTGEQNLVKDCAPKRILLEQQNETNRLASMQGSVDKLNHEVEKLSTDLKSVINQARFFINEYINQVSLLENKGKNNDRS